MTLRTPTLLLTALLLTVLAHLRTPSWPAPSALPVRASAVVYSWASTPPAAPADLVMARPTRFSWPLAPPHPVVRPFTPPVTQYGAGHRGVDLGAPVDEPVVAAGDGVVAFAGPLAGRGVVSVDHPGGIRTTYEPVTVLVTRHQQVRVGMVLGSLAPGHGGCVGAPACLHWGARRGATYLNPLALLSGGRVRLLPWTG